MDQRGERAVRLRAEHDALLGGGTAADDAEHALARQHDPHRPAGEPRRGGGQDLVVPQAFPAKAATDIGRDHANLLILQAEHARDRRRGRVHELARVMDDKFLAFPRDRRGVQFDRVVVMARRTVGTVDNHRRAGQRRLGIADLEFGWFAEDRFWRVRPALGGLERRDRRLGVIADLDQCGGMIGLLLGLGEHHRHGLTIPVDARVLHDRQGARPGRRRRCEKERGRIHPRCVLVGHHQHDARRGFGGSGPEPRDPPAGDRAMHQRGIGQPIHRHLGGETRLALHLERAIDPGDGRADQSVPAHHRIGRAG